MERRLKVILASKGMTAKDLSNITKISQSTISSFLNGKRDIKFSTLKKICLALSIDIRELFIPVED
ncbi:helix-turn-helix domain-containing protein [Granulicatella adiacens]|uniref:helix-turn-helix domain-containing protein n=1 Tax=Granulicatella adiacens TaxID=46124 RepID=UPI001C3C32DD|nr:helix-turn-helix transcriptional regulator [Granulicatella adiacens]